MDSLDIRNLYAAYRSVYEDQQSLTEEVDVELDEAKAEAGKSDFEKNDIRGRRYIEKTQGKKGVENYDKSPVETRGNWVGAARRRAHTAQHNEEVDVYDLVLDYLLDEGFCDDVESAEVIMANMSEEWLEEILDEETKGEAHMFKGAKELSSEHRKKILRITRKQASKNEDNRTDRQKILGVKLSSMRDRNERRGYYDEPNEAPRGSRRGAESPTDR